MKTYSKSDIEKIGNVIIYLAQRIPDLSKTKLLKLLYLLEEVYVKNYQLPFLNLEFNVWQAGPVAKDIFIECADEPNLLKGFITLNKTNEATYIKPQKGFEDDEFSDNEIDMMDFIIEKFGDKTAKELVQYTHRKGSPWYQIAEQKGLLEAFQKGLTNSSDEKIDFCYYLPTQEDQEKYLDQVHFNRLVSYIND